MNNLSITTVKGQIGIDTARGSYSIRQPKGEQSITQKSAKMNIDKQAPKVIIDQYDCFAEVGLKNNIDFITEVAQLGKQAAIKAIGRIVEDGNRMAMIQKRMPPAIPELAEKNSRPTQYEFNFKLIPTSRPKIDVEGYLNINWELGGAEISYSPKKHEIDYNLGKVNIYMKQYPEIKYQYIDDKI
ncbi:DUF6470 family protein [Gottschalkia acidurici]|nr:DUF6470 family protein [Gottschalkia acidurici]